MGLGLRAVRACLGLLWPPLTSPEPPTSNPEGGAFGFLVPPVASAWLHSQRTERSLGSGREKGVAVLTPKGALSSGFTWIFILFYFFLYKSLT